MHYHSPSLPRVCGIALFAAAGISCSFGQSTPSTNPNFASLPAFMSATYDVRSQTYGFGFLDASGALLGQPLGTIKPISTITYTPTSLSNQTVPQFLNASYGGIDLIDSNKLNMENLGNLLNVWQSSTASYDLSYGLDHNFLPAKDTSALLTFCGAVDWKQNDQQQQTTSARASLQGQYALVLWQAKPPATTPGGKLSDEIRPLSSRTNEIAAAYLLHFASPNMNLDGPAMQAVRAAIKPVTDTVVEKQSKSADDSDSEVMDAVGKFRSIRGVIPEVHVAELTTNPVIGKSTPPPPGTPLQVYFMDDHHIMNAALTAPDMQRLNEYADQIHTLLAKPRLVNEYFKPYVAQAKAAEQNNTGASLKFSCQGFAWYDTGPGSALEGFIQGGLVYSFARKAGDSSSVVPGISVTYLDGTAPANVNLSKGYLEINFVIAFPVK